MAFPKNDQLIILCATQSFPPDHLCTHRQYRRRFRASRQKSRCRRAPGFIKCKAMKKIKLLSVDAIKAIYEREMAKKGLPADCDETKLAEHRPECGKGYPTGRGD